MVSCFDNKFASRVFAQDIPEMAHLCESAIN